MTEEIRIDGQGNIIEFLKSIQSRLDATDKSTQAFQEGVSGTLAKYQKQLNSFSLTNFYNQLQNVSQGLSDLSGPGLDFNTQLMDLSALTGTTGTDLDKLGEKARESAKQFGGTAADSLNTYKVILGRLGPDIAKNQGALSAMEKNVQTLSKTMGNDAPGAVDALTTAMLQYGVDLSDPAAAQKEMANMMDIMARSAQKGAAEVPSISAALKVSGVAAKMANVSFAETNSAIQALAQGGKEGSEAGTALRNVLGKMAGEDIIPKEAAGKLKALGVDMNIVSDKTLPFTDRLRELKKAEGDATVMAQVFGVENEAAARILLQSVDAQDTMTGAIQKGAGAMDMAKTVMESKAEKTARLKARIDDIKISFFEATGGVTAYLGPINEVMTTMTAFAPVVGFAKTAVMALATAEGRAALVEKGRAVVTGISTVATHVATAAQWLWNAALNANPIGLVIVAVAALSAAIYGVTQALNQQTAAQKLATDINSRAIEKSIDERVEMTRLFNTLKNTKKGTDEYTNALKELDAKYPGIIEKYRLHEGKLQNIIAAEKELSKQIMHRATVEAAGEILKEKTKEGILASTRELSITEEIGRVTMGISEKEFRKRLRNDSEKEQKAISDWLAKQQASEMTATPPKGTTGDATATDLGTETGTGSGKPVTAPSGYSKSSGSESGAGQVKSINVRIENLVNSLTVSTTNMGESTAELKRLITEALMAAVRDFEVAI